MGRTSKSKRVYQSSPYAEPRPATPQLPRWIPPPPRYCGSLTFRIMRHARPLHLEVSKNPDGRIALFHRTYGLMRSEENSDRGKRLLIQWLLDGRAWISITAREGEVEDTDEPDS